MGNRIISELPLRKDGKTDCKNMVGMTINIIWNDVKYNVNIVDYIVEKSIPKFKTICNGVEAISQCGCFLNGIFSGVVGYTLPSKNKFEYSEEHDCWFGWTPKGEKFAFDGDEEIVEFIKSHTWGIYSNKVECGKIKKSLKQTVLGLESTRRRSITHISDELNLGAAYLDNRKCNLTFRDWGKSNRVNYKRSKTYDYNMEVCNSGEYIKVKSFNEEYFLIDNDETIIGIINNNKCVVDSRRGNKKYVRCGNTDLHREILGITENKYSEWFVDHLNGDGLDNRLENLVITDHYGNMCNKQAKGYIQTSSGSYKVQFMCRYYDYDLYNLRPRVPTFKNEDDAIKEVERRRKYIMENRIRFHNKYELDMFLEWYSKNNYNNHNEAWESYKLKYFKRSGIDE